jgi:hypothetical protein
MILKRSQKHPAKDMFKKEKQQSAKYDLESLESLWTQISQEPDMEYPAIREYPDTQPHLKSTDRKFFPAQEQSIV